MKKSRLQQILLMTIDTLYLHLCKEDRIKFRSNYFSDLTDAECEELGICDEEDLDESYYDDYDEYSSTFDKEYELSKLYKKS